VDIVAGPYHRNASGILFSHQVMAAKDSKEALGLIRERGIDLVVICVTEDWMPLVPADSAGTFYNALVEGRPPDWLRLVPLKEVPDRYRLFEVVEGR